MKKVLKSIPSVRYIAITMVVSLVIGLIVSGPNPKALLMPIIGVLFLIMVTMRNHDPMRWEAVNDPLAHSMRQQRDVLAYRLKAIVDCFPDNIGATPHFGYELDQARLLLDEIYPSKLR